MSYSKEQRMANAELALRRMTEKLGDRAFYEMMLETSDQALVDIFPTTFELLEEKGLAQAFRAIGWARWGLTADGWLAGIQLLGQLEEAKQRVGPIMAAIKDCVKGRQSFVFMYSGAIAQKAGVSAGFMANVLESDFITRVLSRKSVDSARRGKPDYLLKIPIDFGLELL